MTYKQLDVCISFGIVGAFLGALIGELDGLLIALIIFMVVDYITGVLSAIVKKKVNSNVGYVGILRKCAMLLVVIVANVLDTLVLKEGSVCRTAVILFYLSNEGISIMENYCKMGLPFPEKLKKVLEQLKDTSL